MTTDYILLKAASGFEVTDPYGETEIFPTEEEAKEDMEESKGNDEMLERGKRLVDVAIRTHMELCGIDRETAKYWIRSAAKVTD